MTFYKFSELLVGSFIQYEKLEKSMVSLSKI